MNKHVLTLEDVLALHQSGQAEEARLGYLALLAENPHDAAAWHYLGLLSAELGDFQQSYDCFQKAITLDPQNVTLYLHFAAILKSEKKYIEAIAQLQLAMAISPSFPAIHNNLGSIYFAQMKWSDAVKHYQTAIDLQPNYVDAYYNLGLALKRLGQPEEAMAAFQALIELSDQHPGGLFQLGCSYMRRKQYHEALPYFKTLELIHPFHFETQTNLATCYLRLGQLNEAKAHYSKAMEITSDDTQVLFNLGVISTQQGFLSQAFEYYQRALNANPNLFEAHNNIAVTYLAMKNDKAALMHFKEAMRLQPDNAAIQYSVDLLSGGKTLTRAPAAYLSSLFDSYADHYDNHMRSSLSYVLPERMHELVVEQLGQMTGLVILDVGCGTGLCGPWLRPMANRLVGVDLSKSMLDEARHKHCYDQLIHADMTDILSQQENTYDLIVAADVLVYLGQLEQVFEMVYQALRQKGLFLFNCELGSADHYEVAETGRYRHNRAYLEQLIEGGHFEMIATREAISRTQSGEDVKTQIYLLKK